MASLSFTHFLSLPRWQSKLSYCPSSNIIQLKDLRLHNKWGIIVAARKGNVESSAEGDMSDNETVVKKKTSRTPKRATSSRTRKKPKANELEEKSESEIVSDASDDESALSALNEDTKKTIRRARKQASSASIGLEKEITEKKARRRKKSTKKTGDSTEAQISDSEVSDSGEFVSILNVEDESEEEIELEIDEGEDIAFTYGWPPLVCCFGAAQHAFVPSGRPAHRLIDHEIHERMKDTLWAPEKFVRAPGGCVGSVAVALASLGGKVAFMGKLGDDEFGQAMLYYMNENNVQTRSVRVDTKRVTAASQMKIGKRGRLRLTSVKPCAEDCLSKSEINIDVLKEAKMFYFSSHSLLDRNMRSTTLHAIKISKKFGGVVFYDVNLPLPLWHSGEETKILIKRAWNLADVIEVTKQELEFLCGIKPTEEFDTESNDRSKFAHYEPEVITPIWHENLKVLFVTNGTSKIHYYTKEHNGAILGMEDAPLTPFTSDMSASGDGIVAGIMRMLTVQPQLITDKGYLERTIKYAIECGVTDQWLLSRIRGFPPKESEEEEDEDEEVEPDPNGIRSITEKEFRTVKAVGSPVESR